MDYSDEELYSLSLEGNEDAKNMLYNKYKHIVDVLIKKYLKVMINSGIDTKEVEQEAFFAFSDALNSYRDDKNASIGTFISLCVDRRIRKVIKSQSGEKAKVLGNIYSLDYDYEEGLSLQDIVSDKNDKDPLYNLTNEEDYRELLRKIKEKLSESEYEIFEYMTNSFDYNTIAILTNKTSKQVDNTIQRIKHKIRDIIKE